MIINKTSSWKTRLATCHMEIIESRFGISLFIIFLLVMDRYEKRSRLKNRRLQDVLKSNCCPGYNSLRIRRPSTGSIHDSTTMPSCRVCRIHSASLVCIFGYRGIRLSELMLLFLALVPAASRIFFSCLIIYLIAFLSQVGRLKCAFTHRCSSCLFFVSIK